MARKQPTETPPGAKSAGDLYTKEEAAQRILASAKKLLANSGWRSLTVSAISEDAGVYRAAINYHFGGMDGLLAALLDDVVHTSAFRVMSHVRSIPLSDERLKETIREFGMLGGEDVQRVFFEAFTHLLRDEAYRHRLRRLYEDAIAILAVALGGSAAAMRPELRTLATLAMATADGLVIQQLIDPNKDLEPVISQLASLLAPMIEQISEPDEAVNDQAAAPGAGAATGE